MFPSSHANPTSAAMPDPAGAESPAGPAKQSGHGRRRRGILGIGLGVAVVAVAGDQSLKAAAESTLTVGDRYPILGDVLAVQLAYNAGAAFSLGAAATPFITLIAAAGVAVAAWLIGRTSSLSWMIGLALVLGGALSNLIDRLARPPGFARGHVVDYLAYGDLFIGNLADIFVFAGVAVCLALTLTGRRLRTERSQPGR